MSTTKHEWVYVARKQPCGCVCGGYVDIPGNEDVTAREVGKFIMAGYAVSREPVANGICMTGCSCVAGGAGTGRTETR